MPRFLATELRILMTLSIRLMTNFTPKQDLDILLLVPTAP
jgi:hypothetical protein